MFLQLHSCSEVQKTDRSHKRRKVSTNPGDLCGIQVKIFLEMTRAGKKCPDLKKIVCNLVPIGRHVTFKQEDALVLDEGPTEFSQPGGRCGGPLETL